MSLGRKLRRLGHDEAGFSLIEMLTVLTILLIVLGTLTVLMVSATKSEVELTKRVEAQQQARLALEKMRRDVHCASATNLTTDVAAATVTLTLPIACPSAGGETAITWCTSGGGSKFVLRRITPSTGDPATCTGGRPEADYLIQANLFTLRTGLNKLAKLCSVFPIDLEPTEVGGSYRLKDALVLRNSARGTAGTQAAC